MILTCGHIVAESSAKKLANIDIGGGYGSRFKCPICPKEQQFSNLKKLAIY